MVYFKLFPWTDRVTFTIRYLRIKSAMLCHIYMLYHQDAQMVVDYKYSGWIKKDYTEKALENQYSVEIQFFNVGNAYVNF